MSVDQSVNTAAALLELMKKTGYDMIQENGQRRYGGPPPGWKGPPPHRGCEVFVGKIPRDIYEDKLVPLFERAGRIYEFRLMMQFSGENRGYGFVMYTTTEAAQRAISLFDNYEIRPGKFIGVCVSLNKCRLFIGSIPKDMKKEEIQEEMMNVTDGVVDVIVYTSATDKTKNRGFAFVEYESHKAAALARRILVPGTFQLCGQTVKVNWAKPEKDVDKETMEHVRVLYVRNLMLQTTEETLRLEFSRLKPGSVERVKKLIDYAFIHFYCREDALAAQQFMNGKLIDGSPVEVMLAKPASKDTGQKYRSRLGDNETAPMLYSNSNLFIQSKDDSEIIKGSGVLNNGFSTHPLSLSSWASSSYSVALEQCVYPGSNLVPIGMQSLKPCQLGSAVALLEYYCQRNGLSLPEYYLYTVTPPNYSNTEEVPLICKVVISSRQSSFMSSKFCTVVDEAKELAAQTALLHVDLSFSGLGSPCSFSPPAVSCQAIPYTPNLISHP